MFVDVRIADINSSNIKNIKFEASINNDDIKYFSGVKGTLTVVYNNDSTYNYLDVPLAVLGNIFIHDSVGATIAKIVKPSFESERVGI